MSKIKALFSALFLALFVFALAACTQGECTKHKDNDEDGICDNCDESIACVLCVDVDKNARCDICGSDVECTTCIDVDKNARCDVCGSKVKCTACVDFDFNGKCDVCKKKVPFVATYHATMTIKDYGTIHIELYGNQAPITVANFVKLANDGKYNGTTFHRIIDGFMAQGGKVTGASSITGEFESNDIENPIYIERGVIAMARAISYPDSATSQFFIVQDSESSKHLNGDYAAFGRVTSGMDIIDQICEDAVPYDDDGYILAVNQPVITNISIYVA